MPSVLSIGSSLVPFRIAWVNRKFVEKYDLHLLADPARARTRLDPSERNDSVAPIYTLILGPLNLHCRGGDHGSN